ncbi:tyrosine-type recombinase/integrase [Bacteroidia bacterium]|nr:tyrosine-type recombinase/integrase [Bacteroidia bacterium]
MTTKFLLRNAKATTKTPINVRIAWKTNSMLFSTGEKVHPNFFLADNAANINTRISTNYKNSDKLNKAINNKRYFLKECFDNYVSNYGFEPLTSADFKNFIQDEKKRIAEVTRLKKEDELRAAAKKVTLYKAIDAKADKEEKRLLAEGKAAGKSSVVYHYKRLKAIIQNFDQEREEITTFENISMDWYYSFNDYLNDRDYTPNYKGKLIKNIKAVMNLGLEEGYSINTVHKNEDFKKEGEATHKVYLNEAEIEHLFEFDFSNDNELTIARDWLVLGCTTSLRISDQKRINKDCIITTIVDTYNKGIRTDIEKKFIRIVTTKTKKEVDIPLNEQPLAILEKHNYDLPKLYDQKYNKLVKKVCEIAGINGIEKFTKKEGNKEVKYEVPKYELISSHTGRRSYATNLYKQGFPTISIMAITGHSKVKDFENYIVLDANEHAKVLARHQHKLEEEKIAAKQHLKLA